MRNSMISSAHGIDTLKKYRPTMLTKLMSTLAIRNSAAAVRVTIRRPRTPVIMRSSTGESLNGMQSGPVRQESNSLRSNANVPGSLRRPLRGPFGRLRYNVIGIVEPSLWPRYVLADAGDSLHELRLIRRRQADQFAATGGPCFARFVEQRERSRIDRHGFGGGVFVDDLLQVRRQ